MGFLGVYSAVYDYQPQGEGELEIKEGDVLYILDKNSDDDWWKAKKKAERDDEDEPEGLVPNNYVEEVSPRRGRCIGCVAHSAHWLRRGGGWPRICNWNDAYLSTRNVQAQPKHQAKGLFDYTRQTDEEVSFSEDAEILVYDTSDPDWTLVGVGSDYGFAPANYIEIVGDAAAPAAGTTAVPPPPPAATEPAAPSLPTRPTQPAPEEYEETPSPSPINTLQILRRPQLRILFISSMHLLARNPSPRERSRHHLGYQLGLRMNRNMNGKTLLPRLSRAGLLQNSLPRQCLSTLPIHLHLHLVLGSQVLPWVAIAGLMSKSLLHTTGLAS